MDKNYKKQRELASVIDAPIDVLSWPDTLAQIATWAHNRESRYVCICNVHSVITTKQDAAFLKVIVEADMATPDGSPIANWVTPSKSALMGLI